MANRRILLMLVIAGAVCLARPASAQLTFNYNFTVGTNVPDDGSSQLTDNRTMGGIGTFTNVVVRLNLSSPDGNNPMVLGDMYSSLTMGPGTRTAVLLNRPGVDDNDA